MALPGVFLFSIGWGSSEFGPKEMWQALGQREALDPAARILWEMRLPRTLTALVAGAGLALAGLLMQTLFRNILAGPYVLGISSGASLGVALVILVGTGSAWGIMGAAALGAMTSMSFILILSRYFRSPVSLLVVGMMVGYIVDALVSLLIHFGNPDRLQSFVTWGFGSFGRVTWNEIGILTIIIVFCVLFVLPTLPYLNTVLLGEEASAGLGIRVGRNRVIVLTVASLITATVTVYCGPIAFIGMAVPQLSRSIFRTADHRILIPATLWIGATLSIAAGWIANLPSSGGVLPLNSATALLGAPVVLWTLTRYRGEHG